jgi:hypothetical protein
MSRADYIPRIEAGFNTWVNVLIAYLAANSVKFNFSPEVLADLLMLQATWKTKYAIATRPETRTKATVQEKYQARKELEIKEVKRFISACVGKIIPEKKVHGVRLLKQLFRENSLCK